LKPLAARVAARSEKRNQAAARRNHDQRAETLEEGHAVAPKRKGAPRVELIRVKSSGLFRCLPEYQTV
jgi:hypothetical protein